MALGRRQSPTRVRLHFDGEYCQVGVRFGAVAYTGLSEILAPDLIFTSAACPSQMGCDEVESYIRTRPVFDVYVR